MLSRVLLSAALCCLAHATKKVLVLHGGGQSAQGMSYVTTDLRNALGSDYEFVFGHIGSTSTGEAWWADPVNKATPTTSRDQAQGMVEALNTIVANNGPFDGIMGYSQGAAAIPVYLSQVKNGSFKWAVMFCGYIPTTHQGLVARISERSPFGNIRAMIWMSHEDPIISNPMSVALSKKFTSPSVVVDDHGGPHIPPDHTKATFNTVVNWIKDPSQTVTVGTPLTTYGSYSGKGKGGKSGKGGKGGWGKGGKGGYGGKGGNCALGLAEEECNAQDGCTYYAGYGCYAGNKGGGKGSYGKGGGSYGKGGGSYGKGGGSYGKGGGKGSWGGKGGGSNCANNLPEETCNSQPGCTYYGAWGCWASKQDSKGKGVDVVKGRHLRG